MQHRPGPVPANLACFFAMFMWAFAFPASEVLLESWGVMALILSRTGLAVAALLVLWLAVDGLAQVLAAPWVRGIAVGGTGFGIGAVLHDHIRKQRDEEEKKHQASNGPLIDESQTLLGIF